MERGGMGEAVRLTARIPEPELMTDLDQVFAYSAADFSESDEGFITSFGALFPGFRHGKVIDLGCGPGNIALRFVARYPEAAVIAVDGSPAMIEEARKLAEAQGISDERVRFEISTIPTPTIGDYYDVVVSNSLLHQLHDPHVLWKTVRECAAPNAIVCIKDLLRPETTEEARELVERYASDAPLVLKEDFFNSLCAAFTLEEIQEQLAENELHLSAQAVSDRHVLIAGRL